MAWRRLTTIEAAVRGLADFDAVARSPRWAALAAFVCRRWKLPPWVSRDDVRQDLLIEAWRKIAQYDPERGVTPDRFVEWNAITFAKKRGHKARGSYRHRGADSAPSRHELSFSSLARDGDDDGTAEQQITSRLAVPPTQLEAIERREGLAALHAASESDVELVCTRALGAADGDLEEAARLLFEDIELRYACRLGSEVRAEQFVRGVVLSVAARLAA